MREEEFRVLLEDTSKSYGNIEGHRPSMDNKLIFGDNLLALKALEAEYTGKVKCIYIDPPYNTGNAFEHYDDGLGRSVWLDMMRDRLEVLWNLLTNDGLMAVQIDDNEFARLYLLLTEICGERNLKTICVKMSEASGLKMGSVRKTSGIPKLKEFIILAKKDGIRNIFLDKIPKEIWDNEYNIFLNNFTKEDKEQIDIVNSKKCVTEEDIEFLDKRIASKIILEPLTKQLVHIKDKKKWCFDNAYRICRCASSTSVLRLTEEKKKFSKQNLFFVSSKNRSIAYLAKATYSTESKKPRVQMIFAIDNLAQHPGDLWTDIKTTGLDNEGGINFKSGKKPEILIMKIIKMNTNPGDLVLDSFAGSGTTGAVAHKMGRKWIMIELGEHCHTHIIPRMQKVIDGTDQGGISKLVNYQGGGGFRYYSLAPSVWGRFVINKKINEVML